MIVEEDDSTISHYLSIFKEFATYYLPNYSILRTKGIIRGSGEEFAVRYFSGAPGNLTQHKHIKGKPDGVPIIGKSFTINGLSWGTSQVNAIIDENIIMTKNSVYAIHSISNMREQKLKNLGVD
jgi:hypothetical protein